MERWNNKVAVVTGASSGIGAACCKYLCENGMIVVGLARRKERVEELRADLKAENRSRLHAIKCDVRVEAEIVETFAEIEKSYGPVSVLVNNAGIVRFTGLVAEGNSQDLRDLVDTNVLGVAFCTREAFRSMKQHNTDGHVILINSVVGHKVPAEMGRNISMYPATKYAITAMTEAYRQEFAANNTKIKITSISPGVVITEILPVGYKEAMKAGPHLNPEDIADAIIYCLKTPPHVQIHELTIKPIGERF